MEAFLVTGALGCIGAWTVRTLVREDVPVVAFDLAGDRRRLELLMAPDEIEKVTFVTGDITDLAAVEASLDAHRITNVIHLAALQVPFSRADPPLGALVNVVGTVNMLEAVKRRRDRIGRLVYTSSIGMFDAADTDPVDGRLHVDAIAHPRTHYGVYKQANEGNANVYWLDDAVSSVGLRPMTVYGPGRDQGLTSGPTRAIAASLLGREFRIGFGGRMVFQYAGDVARWLIAASRSDLTGARVFNLGGSLVAIDEFVATVERAAPETRGLVTFEPKPLPFPEEIDPAGVEDLGDVSVTQLEDGIRATVELFRELIADGRFVPEEHGLAPETTAEPATQSQVSLATIASAGAARGGSSAPAS
jgi:nucleoside-diphosphate-sugar epimerase